MSRPIGLSDSQLDQVFRTAGTVQEHLRDEFLTRLAEILRDKPLGDGMVYCACREASKDLVDYPLTQYHPKTG
jgi:hypothetical protein